jgi:hypothetical protein
LLILPGVALQIIVEPIITAIEMPGLVVFFETTNKNGHSASEGTNERIRGASWFPRGKLGQALQLTRRPGDLYTGKRNLGGNTFQAWEHQLPPLAGLILAEDATAAFSFSDSPAKQRQGVGKKIGVTAKLQLLFQAADHKVLGGRQISLKLRFAHRRGGRRYFSAGSHL